MKTCPKCGNACDDNAAFCVKCGTSFSTGAAPAYTAAPAVDPTDHTAEYDPKDISENKVIAMVPYLMGWLGIVIALLAINNSKYVAFHVKQVMKIQVVSTLLVIIGAALFFTFIVPIAAVICSAILGVIQIIGFFWVCGGKAKELPIVKSLGFLK